jgi:hypothetical protein
MMFLVLLLACALGFAATLSLNLVHRLVHGASLSELAAGRFHEVVAVRGLFWVLYGLAWAANVLTLAIVALMGLALIFGKSRPAGLVVTVIVCGLLAWPCYKLRTWFARKVIYGELPPPPEGSFGSVQVESGIEADEFLRLGSERFPNHIDPSRAAHTLIRWLVLLGGLALAGLFACLAAKQADGPRGPLVDVPLGRAAAGLMLAYGAGVVLLLLLADNRDYTFVPFGLALPIEAGLGVVVFLGVLLMASNSRASALQSVHFAQIRLNESRRRE